MTYDTTNRSGSRPMGAAGTMTMDTSGWNLITAREIEGRNVIGLNDEKIGKVRDLYIDYDEHTARYASVDVGGFLGIGAKPVLVPFEQLQWSGNDLYLPVGKRVLEDAPDFDQMADYDRAYEDGSGRCGARPRTGPPPATGRTTPTLALRLRGPDP